MKTILLDGEKITTKEQLHETLKAQLGVPEYYGNNLAALRDVLRGLPSDDFPMVLKWKNFNKSKAILGDYADKTNKVFEDIAREVEKRGILKVVKE
jgi:ribonuclease inhibitor